MKKIILIIMFFLTTEVLVAKIPEKRLAVVICSYNNAEWYQKNLESLLAQKYENWHAIYVDDYSSDGTADLVKNYIKEHHLESKITLIANKEHKGALANHYVATHMCDDWDVVIQYDGDDWFAHNNVFSMINELYDDQETWLTYGSFEDWPSGVRGYSKPTPEHVVKESLYRETYWTPGQLRTFYAWVFKKIKLEDLLWDYKDEYLGKFYPASCDLAFSYPMMEMVGDHFKYIRDVIYIHNVQTPINDFKVNRTKQIIASNILLYKKKYEPVITPPEKKKQKNYRGTDVVIMKNGDTDLSYSTLISCQTKLKGINKLFIFDLENLMVSGFNGEQFEEWPTTYQNAKELLVKEMHNWWKAASHILFLQNGMSVTEEINLEDLALELEKSQAFAFFPALGIERTGNEPCVHLYKDIFAWRLCYAEPSWLKGEEKLCIFGHKQPIRERIAYMSEQLIKNSLFEDIYGEAMFFISDPTITRIGLSFETPRIQMLKGRRS